MRITTILALSLLLPTLSLGEGHAGPSEKRLPLPKELQGSTIPDFNVRAIDNETEFSRKNLADEAKRLGAKRVIFSFFATWCENCAIEFVKLKENSARLKEKGVLVYLIDVGEKIMQKGDKVKEFVSQYAGDAFPFYFNQNLSLLKNFGIIEQSATGGELPVIVVMDANLKALAVFTKAGNDFPQVLWEDL
ncbi:MAG: redoxin family protein [Fibromonadales bacterium]|nr:redoxin family protein [Fibromonadales bacterium]